MPADTGLLCFLTPTNPNANPNPYELPVQVPPNDITGVKWLEECQITCITIGGLPWQWPRTAVDGRRKFAAFGRPRKLPWQLPRLPRTSVAIAALPWKWPRMAVEITTAVPRKKPWQLTWTSVGCYGWYDGVCHGQNRGTCRGHNRGICRGCAMSLGTGRGNDMSRGACRGNPQIPPVARGNTHGSPREFRSHCCGLPPRSPLMCIRVTMGLIYSEAVRKTEGAALRQESRCTCQEQEHPP